MDKRTWIVILITTGILFGWQKFYNEPKQAASTAINLAATQAQPEAKAALLAPKAKLAELKTVRLDSKTGELLVSNGARWFSNWKLSNYKNSIDVKSAKAIDLKSVTNIDEDVQVAFDSSEYTYLNDIQGQVENTANGILWKYEDQNLKLTRTFTANGAVNGVKALVTAEFKTKKPNYAFILLKAKLNEKDPEERDRLLAYWSGEKIERILLKDKAEVKDVALPVKWISAISHYFVMSIVADGADAPRGLVQPLGTNEAQVALVYPVTQNKIEIPLKVYFGPKDLKDLREFEPTLDHVVDFGMFTIVAYPLLRIMNWFYKYVGNYGLAIILLTVLLKIVTYPLTYKSMKSMKDMARLQPQIEKLKKKYGDNKEALNREMLTLMKGSGANPMMGCLPMLIQMPVFFALYQVLYNSVELYQTPFFFWIQDLSVKDPFYITPVLLTVLMWLQQKMTPSTATDPMQQKMMQLMPVMFGVFMISLPSGLTLYMLTNSITSIIQQVILNKKLGPNTPALAGASI